MADNENSPRQKRIEALTEQGHSLAHATGTVWAEQGDDFTAPPEHGVDPPSTRKEG
jgi:hypothetical protein